MIHIALIELLGYFASILIAVSMFMKDIVKLRIFNLAGSLLFSIYGFIVKTYPVAFMNILIVIVNLYYLYRSFKSKPES